ncbi:hypothetical protein BX616_000978, partial [Lobosporangium transversale]
MDVNTTSNNSVNGSNKSENGKHICHDNDNSDSNDSHTTPAPIAAGVNDSSHRPLFATTTIANTQDTEHLAVITEYPNATDGAQWFYRPYLQPSSISTTATSSLLPYSSSSSVVSLSSSSSSSSLTYHPRTALHTPFNPQTPYPSSTAIHFPYKASLYATLQSSLAGGIIVGGSFDSTSGGRRSRENHPTSTTNSSSTMIPYWSRTTGPILTSGPYHINPSPSPLLIKDEPAIHHNPYRTPSHTNSRAFVPPRVPGYEFSGGSQAGNMGLMMGKRLSDGRLVTGKLHQSRVLLQHEYRILKRLQIANAKYIPNDYPSQPSTSEPKLDLQSKHTEAGAGIARPLDQVSKEGVESSWPRGYQLKSEKKQPVYETGCVETEKYFNRVVIDFVDLDPHQHHLQQEDMMSILVLERLGPNLLSHTHHQWMGLEGMDEHLTPDKKRNFGSPFPDVKTFLIFALKAACILEALMAANLAHLAICPTALHWMPASASVYTASSVTAESTTAVKADPELHKKEAGLDKDKANEIENGEAVHNQQTQSTVLQKDQQQHESTESSSSIRSPGSGPRVFNSILKNMDINDTKLRLFDFTHSKILSHERARAPNNLVEWQVPGYMEYHLQFLAPEQTGRAETWMDHRTDIYGLGATLFTLLTMQYPNVGQDSVQILQGVLSKDLPPLRDFRPDMPPQPSQRYQNAFGFKQDILQCLNVLHRTGRIDSFELGKHDISYQLVLPNSIFGRHVEQQMISACIAQAASAYQQSLNGSNNDDDGSEDDDGDDVFHGGGAGNNDNDNGEISASASKKTAVKNADYYVFEDDIVSLKSQIAKIPLSSKILLRTPKPFDGAQSIHRGHEATDPIVRVVFVSGPSGVGKTMLIRGMAATARNSGLFAGGIFEKDGLAPYSAILHCIQSVLQQLLAQHSDALASLVVAIRTAFEPDSGIGIICDLVPELRYFFSGSEMPESQDIPLSHSVARFHALILKLIRVISTHFFMTWLIDDLQFADENSIDLLATLVNVNKRLPIVLIITHRDTPDCLLKVKHILGGGNIAGGRHPTGFGVLGAMHHDTLMDNLSSTGGKRTAKSSFPSSVSSSSISSSSHKPMSKSTALRGIGSPMVVRGGGGVRFIRLQHPTIDTIQEFLATILHRDKVDVVPLAKVLHQKSWLTIRQLVLELYQNRTIYFNCAAREWEWEACSEILAETVRKLTGEEYAFLNNRFRSLSCNTKRALVCASICGPSFAIKDLQSLVSRSYAWTVKQCPTTEMEENSRKEAIGTTRARAEAEGDSTGDAKLEYHNDNNGHSRSNKDGNAMEGIQTAIREGILVYTSVPDHLRFHHGVMRRVATHLMDSPEIMERLHYEMIKILFNKSGQDFRIASHVLHCLNLIKKKMAMSMEIKEKDSSFISISSPSSTDQSPLSSPQPDSDTVGEIELETKSLRRILSLAGEKSQKSGAQDMALTYWNAALSLLPGNCFDLFPESPPTRVQQTPSSRDVDMDVDKDEQQNEDDHGKNQNCQSHFNILIKDTSATSTAPLKTVPNQQPSLTTLQENIQGISSKQKSLYREALKLHLQCIEAERWRENFDKAMKICEIILSKVTDPIDRARVYEHQIEMSVWAYSSPEQATKITIRCLQELGMDPDTSFDPSESEMRTIFDQTHKMLMEHMSELQVKPPKTCTDPHITMMMEVLNIASASLYYCNVPFMASTIVQSMKLICKYGVTKDAGRALVSFALTYSTWYGCLDNVYELGKLACEVSNGNHHVKFLFHLVVQQWGDHVAHSIPALEETLTAVDLTCDRLFHTAGMIHVSVMKVLLGRIHLNELMTATIDLLAKHIEFGPKSHGVEVMQGILQMIKCLKGKTLASSPETIFDDIDYSEATTKPDARNSGGKVAMDSFSLLQSFGNQGKKQSRSQSESPSQEQKGHNQYRDSNDNNGTGSMGFMSEKKKKKVTMVHNNSTYMMLKVVAAFIFGHYHFVQDVTHVWHDDPKSILNFEGSWIAHSVYTVVGLALVNVLATEADPQRRQLHKKRLFRIRDTMELRARKYPTNHAAMYYLLEAEIADQALTPDSDLETGAKIEPKAANRPDMKQVLLLYETAIKYSVDGDFPLHKCFAFELAAKCHLRHGLVTSAQCLMVSACRVYHTWGAKGKVHWFHRTYPDMFPMPPEVDPAMMKRGLFYRPTDNNSNDNASTSYVGGACPYAQMGSDNNICSNNTVGVPSMGISTTVAGAGPVNGGSVNNNSSYGWVGSGSSNSGSGGASSTSPWMAPSPGVMYSPTMLGMDTSAGMAEPHMAVAFQNGCSSVTSTSSSSAVSTSPIYSLQNTWLSSPQLSEIDNADLDVLDFSSVIEAMQVIASEIDLDLLLVKSLGVLNHSVGAKQCCIIISRHHELVLSASLGDSGRCESVNPPIEVEKCPELFHGVINYVVNTSAPCLLTNAKDDPRFCADEYLKQYRADLKTVLCAPILHRNELVGVLYMENFPERAFANKRMLVMNLLVQQLGISITNALLYQSVLQSENRLMGLLENMPCGIALWDSAAEDCQYVNSTWADMTGFTITEIIQTGWRVVLPPDEMIQYGLAWKERVQAGVPCQWECRYGLKDGTFRWSIVRMLPIKAPSPPHKILQWLTVTIDIDDQRKAVQLKSNFLANMSHELRTPFSGILGMLSLLRDSKGLSHEQFEFVDMAKASCEMLIRIVDDLLNFSKLEADKVTLEYIPLCFEEILG